MENQVRINREQDRINKLLTEDIDFFVKRENAIHKLNDNIDFMIQREKKITVPEAANYIIDLVAASSMLSRSSVMRSATAIASRARFMAISLIINNLFNKKRFNRTHVAKLFNRHHSIINYAVNSHEFNKPKIEVNDIYPIVNKLCNYVNKLAIYE